MSGAMAGRRLHFVGIGGAGMSGLALVCHELGAAVSGSDRADSSYMERLRAAGLEPVVGHDAANLPPGAEVVVSTAIGADNPELALARERGQAVHHRGELLAELCAEKRLIAVVGTHGKTTTAAMLAWALRALGEDPAFFVGGEAPGLGPEGEAANAGWGAGEWAVAEADESDGSFLRLEPEIAVLTNVEMDHHSHWGSEAELRAAFERFVKPVQGAALPAAAGLRAGSPRYASGAAMMHGVASANKEVIRFGGREPGPAELDLAVPGVHNLLNARAALAAIELALAGSAPEGKEELLGRAAAALAEFPGVGRRLEYKGERDGVRVFDDYAHHPTEVRAALRALRELEPPPERLIVVFQPHLYSRTKVFAGQFGAALALADEAIVLDVYPAREEPVGALAGVSGLDVARVAADRMAGRPVVWAPTLGAARMALASRLVPGAIAVTIGAGDVHRVAEALVGEGDGDGHGRPCTGTTHDSPGGGG